jgi:hypothetical protein
MSDLTRLTVNLSPDATRALSASSDQASDTNADVINRALVGWAAFLRLVDGGGGELTFHHRGTTRTVRIK